jgi:peptidyl-prolyl cis-trans isomerase SurA
MCSKDRQQEKEKWNKYYYHFLPTVKKKIELLADSLYQLIQSGQSFEQIAKQFSTDNASAYKGGLLPEIGIGEYAVSFEENVFSLKQINEITKPFATSFGYHLVKLLEIIPAEKIAETTIRSTIENNDRLLIAKQKLIKSWLIKTNYQKAVYDENELKRFVDSSVKSKSISSFQKVNENTVLFSFTKQKITAKDFMQYIKNQTSTKSTTDLLKEFTEKSCSNYYRLHLEEYNSSLKQQLLEFNEANVLFAAMDKHIWSRSVEDSVGLKIFYNTHSQKYIWQPSVAALVITANNKSLVNEVIERIKQRPAEWKSIASSYGESVVGDSGRYEIEHLPVQQKIKMEKGFISTPEKAANEEAYSFIYVVDVFESKDQRSFEESRGMVMNDYQQVLEENWIVELKKKYPVKVNKEIFKTIK